MSIFEFCYKSDLKNGVAETKKKKTHIYPNDANDANDANALVMFFLHGM